MELKILSMSNVSLCLLILLLFPTALANPDGCRQTKYCRRCRNVCTNGSNCRDVCRFVRCGPFTKREPCTICKNLRYCREKCQVKLCKYFFTMGPCRKCLDDCNKKASCVASFCEKPCKPSRITNRKYLPVRDSKISECKCVSRNLTGACTKAYKFFKCRKCQRKCGKECYCLIHRYIHINGSLRRIRLYKMCAFTKKCYKRKTVWSNGVRRFRRVQVPCGSIRRCRYRCYGMRCLVKKCRKKCKFIQSPSPSATLSSTPSSTLSSTPSSTLSSTPSSTPSSSSSSKPSSSSSQAPSPSSTSSEVPAVSSTPSQESSETALPTVSPVFSPFPSPEISEISMGPEISLNLDTIINSPENINSIQSSEQPAISSSLLVDPIPESSQIVAELSVQPEFSALTIEDSIHESPVVLPEISRGPEISAKITTGVSGVNGTVGTEVPETSIHAIVDATEGSPISISEDSPQPDISENAIEASNIINTEESIQPEISGPTNSNFIEWSPTLVPEESVLPDISARILVDKPESSPILTLEESSNPEVSAPYSTEVTEESPLIKPEFSIQLEVSPRTVVEGIEASPLFEPESSTYPEISVLIVDKSAEISPDSGSAGIEPEMSEEPSAYSTVVTTMMGPEISVEPEVSSRYIEGVAQLTPSVEAEFTITPEISTNALMESTPIIEIFPPELSLEPKISMEIIEGAISPGNSILPEVSGDPEISMETSVTEASPTYSPSYLATFASEPEESLYPSMGSIPESSLIDVSSTTLNAANTVTALDDYLIPSNEPGAEPTIDYEPTPYVVSPELSIEPTTSDTRKVIKRIRSDGASILGEKFVSLSDSGFSVGDTVHINFYLTSGTVFSLIYNRGETNVFALISGFDCPKQEPAPLLVPLASLTVPVKVKSINGSLGFTYSFKTTKFVDQPPCNNSGLLFEISANP